MDLRSTRHPTDAPPPATSSPATSPSVRPGEARAFAVLLTVTFISITATNAIRPTVTYHALGLGATAFDVGLVQSAFSLLPVLTAVAIGRRIDRGGEAWYMVGGLAVLAAGAGVAAASGSLVTLGIAQALMGFGAITMLIGGQAMVANRGSREGRDRRYATYTTVMAVAQLIGPSLAAAILGAAPGSRGESLVFVVAAVGVGAAAGVALLFPRGPARARAHAAGASPAAASTPTASTAGARPAAATEANADAETTGLARAAAAVLRRPGMPAAMFVSVVVISTVDVLAAYLPVYGESAGLSVAVVGGLLSIRAGATLVSRLFMVWLIARLGRRMLLALSLAISALGLGLVPMTASPAALAVLMILGGFALGMGQPMTIAWVADRATRRDRAMALAVRLTGNRGALLVVPAAMGVVAGAAGVAAIFWAIAALLGTGAAVAYGTSDDETDPDDQPVPALPQRS